MIIKKYISLVIILCSLPLFSAEIVFPSGDAFLVEVVSEDAKVYRVKYKEGLYTIPKSDLDKVDLLKPGRDRSYKYLQFTLKDGSKIKGVLAEENNKEFIIQSELGFVTIDKSRIQGEIPESQKPETIDPKYSFSEPLVPETRIGIFGSMLASPGLGMSRSGGLYIEPAYFKYSKFQFGYKLEKDFILSERKTTCC